MKIGFYVSGNATRLKKIIELDNTLINNNIVIVVNDGIKNVSLEHLCEKNNIEYLGIDYRSLHADRKLRNIILSDILLETFNLHGVSYCFCFGEHILKGKLLDEYKNRIINFHPSILPQFPGLNAIDKALATNNFLLGNTAHFVDEGIDTGPIISQSVVHRSVFDSHGYDGILDLQIPMFLNIYNWLKTNRIKIIDAKVEIEKAKNKLSYFPELDF